jgi:hypothetical protein
MTGLRRAIKVPRKSPRECRFPAPPFHPLMLRRQTASSNTTSLLPGVSNGDLNWMMTQKEYALQNCTLITHFNRRLICSFTFQDTWTPPRLKQHRHWQPFRPSSVVFLRIERLLMASVNTSQHFAMLLSTE